MKRLLYIALLMVGIGLSFSCSDKEHKTSLLDRNSVSEDSDTVSKKHDQLDKYVYKDSCGIIHSDLDCFEMYEVCTPHQGVERIYLEDLSLKDIKVCCRECISNDMYDSLHHMALEHHLSGSGSITYGHKPTNKKLFD